MTLVNPYGEAESNGWSEEARQILSNGDSWESWKLIWDVMCSVWALFILRYLSYITNVLITEVSALRVSTVRGQPLCCGHCQSMLPPLFCASPTLWQQLAISHLVRGLQSLSEQGLTLWHNSLPLQTRQSKREQGIRGMSHASGSALETLLPMTGREEAKCHLVFQSFRTVKMVSLAE